MYTSFLIPNIALNEYQKSKLIDISKMIDIPMNIRYGDFAVEGETVMTGGIKIYNNNNLNIIRDFIFFDLKIDEKLVFWKLSPFEYFEYEHIKKAMLSYQRRKKLNNIYENN